MKNHLSTPSKKKLYFLALLPDESIQREVTQIKEYFAEKYHSRAALKSPPHITLFPPFYFELEHENVLISKIKEFASEEELFDIELQNFNAFSPRVIYIDVLLSEKLVSLQNSLESYVKENLNLENKQKKGRTFSPHMTVAFHDLAKENFFIAWREFREKAFSEIFIPSGITILKHNGKNWDVLQTAKFLKLPFSKP